MNTTRILRLSSEKKIPPKYVQAELQRVTEIWHKSESEILDAYEEACQIHPELRNMDVSFAFMAAAGQKFSTEQEPEETPIICTLMLYGALTELTFMERIPGYGIYKIWHPQCNNLRKVKIPQKFILGETGIIDRDAVSSVETYLEKKYRYFFT